MVLRTNTVTMKYIYIRQALSITLMSILFLVFCGTYSSKADRLWKVSIISPTTGIHKLRGIQVVDGVETGIINYFPNHLSNTIEFSYHDSKSDIWIEKEILDHLIGNNEANVIIAELSIENLEYAIDMASKHKVMLIITSQVPPINKSEYSCNGQYVAYTGISSLHITHPVTQLIKKADANTIMIITSNDIFGRSISDIIKKHPDNKNRKIHILHLSTMYKYNSYGFIASQINKLNPNILFALYASHNATHLAEGISQIQKEFQQMKVFAWGETDTYNTNNYPTNMITSISNYLSSYNHAENVSFLRIFRRTFKKQPDIHTIYGYDAINLLFTLFSSHAKETPHDLSMPSLITIKSPRGELQNSHGAYSQDIHTFSYSKTNVGNTQTIIQTFPHISSTQHTCE